MNRVFRVEGANHFTDILDCSLWRKMLCGPLGIFDCSTSSGTVLTVSHLIVMFGAL